MVKFNSWFKDKSVHVHDDRDDQDAQNENLEFPGNIESIPDIDLHQTSADTDEKSPSPQSVFKRMRSAFSAAISKLPGHPKPLYKRHWFWTWLGLGGSAAAISYGIWSIDQQLPKATELNSITREQTLTIKAADGSILRQSGPATRDHLSLGEVPEKLRQAFIAAEDRRFQQHDGVDYQGIVRAVVNNIRSQGMVEGGSTITQQLSRILFLNQEKTLVRKLREVRLAQKMERELTKDEILERYLNLVYLGAGAYGVADAAWVYFSKNVDELTLAEMATIAGLAPAPSIYAPDRNPSAAKVRRNLVLQRMLEDGYITPSEREAAVSEELVIKPSLPKRTQTTAPYFTSYIEKELPKLVPQDVLAAGGLTVETTLDPKWQEYAEAAVNKTIRNRGHWERFQQGALVSLNPRTGEIKAMVGGKDFENNQFNRVTQAQRQPGSTFKAFVYAAAIASGQSPYDTYIDAPYVVDGYEPKNFDEGFRGSMDIRSALTKSVNVIAVKALVRTGFQPTIKLAQDMGIKSPLKPTYSLALGSNEVNLLELTSAYGSFANEGLHTEAHGISRILNRQGDVLWQAQYQPKRVLDADSAAIMTWMLRNVVTSGTGSPASLDKRAVAGKTGTTDKARDLWFIGYIPQAVTGVWLGNDNNRPTQGSSATAAYTWQQFMSKATLDLPVEKFPELPKLRGRKASIKAEPIKPRRVVNLSIPIANQSNTSDDAETPRRRRRRNDSINDEANFEINENRPSRRRRRHQQPAENSPVTTIEQNQGTRRRRRRINRHTNDGNQLNQTTDNSVPSRSRRRRSNPESNSPQPRRRSSAQTPSGSGLSSGTDSSSGDSPSWRERLRPSAGE